MTVDSKVEALIAAAQDLADRAMADEGLAERLLANTNETVAEAAGQPIPAGVLMRAEVLEGGVIEITAQQFEGELDDAALDGVAGGRDIEPATIEPSRTIIQVRTQPAATNSRLQRR